jgi:type IV secretory pathway VirJ component
MTMIILVLMIAACCLGATRTSTFEGGRYGTVKIVAPSEPARGFVILFSDRKGLNANDDAAAQTLADAGAIVAEVNTPRYIKALDKTKEKCHGLDGDAEWLSRQVQRERGFPNYLTPILAGTGEGATIALMTLAHAPAVTIAGVVALNPSATIVSKRPMCSSAAIVHHHHAFRYELPKTLPGFASIDFTSNESKRNRDYLASLKREDAPVQIEEVALHPSEGDTLRALIEPHLVKPRPKVHIADISNLPLDVLPITHPSNVMAIVMSGDGGWRDLDKTIAEDLQHDGVPVVGWDSLRYFWSKKTPDQTANDLANVMRAFIDKWHADDVALIGYSFGADVMPFAYNRLPEDVREHVKLIALLGFSKTADWEITVSGWLGEPPGPKALPVLPEADKIPPTLMQCFYGKDEGDSACPDLAKRGVQVISTSGGHHFNGDYTALAHDIMARLQNPSIQARQSK